MAYGVDKNYYADLDELTDDVEETSEKFMKAADHLKGLTNKLDNNTLLELYGYYKQGLAGPCNIPKPSWYDTKGKAKWEAWNALGNMSRSEAQNLYIETIEKISPDFLASTSNVTGWVAISRMQTNEKTLNESEKRLTDYVKENNFVKVQDILQLYNKNEVANIINKLDDDGLGLIHWAADRGSPEVLNIILSHGGDVNLVDVDSQTALHYAASCGHVDCIHVLLKNNADVNVKDSDGLDPKAVATDENIVKLLSTFI